MPQLWVCVNALVAHAVGCEIGSCAAFYLPNEESKDVRSQFSKADDWTCPEELWMWILFFLPLLPAFCSNSPEGAVKESFVLRTKWEQRLTKVAVATIIAWSTCKAPRGSLSTLSPHGLIGTTFPLASPRHRCSSTCLQSCIRSPHFQNQMVNFLHGFNFLCALLSSLSKESVNCYASSSGAQPAALV